MAVSNYAPNQSGLVGRLGDPTAAGFKIRTMTDAALMLADESYIVATLNIVQELQEEYKAAFGDSLGGSICDPRVSWKNLLDYCASFDQLRHTLDFAVLKLKDALRAFDEYDALEEPPYHGGDAQ